MDWGKAFTVMALVTGFSMKIDLYLMLVKQSLRTLIVHDTLRNMDFEQVAKRDRCFKPEKLEEPLTEFFLFNWTEFYLQIYEPRTETLSSVVNCFGCMIHELAFSFTV